MLVTGGCGFIGTHTVFELLQKQQDGGGIGEVVVIDNLVNSSESK